MIKNHRLPRKASQLEIIDNKIKGSIINQSSRVQFVSGLTAQSQNQKSLLNLQYVQSSNTPSAPSVLFPPYLAKISNVLTVVFFGLVI